MSEELSLSLYDIETGLAEAIMDAESDGGDETALVVVEEWLKGALIKRDRVAAFRQHLIAQQEFADQEMARLRERKESMKRHQERLEGLVVRIMETLDVRKLEGQTATFKLRKLPDTVVITGEVPLEFMNTPKPPEPKPDKRAIKEAIQGGRKVPGADIQFGGDKLQVS